MFLNSIHNFRGLSIIFIVAGHTCWMVPWEHDSISFLFTVSFLRDASTYFIFIAGFLFHYLSKKYEFYSYMRKKLRFVILPYLLVSIPAIIKLVFFDNDGLFMDYPAYQQIFYYYITGAHIVPFWFIPVVTLMYLSAPVLIYTDRNNTLYYSLPVLILISYVITRIADPESLLRPIQLYVHFFSAYVLGMFFSRYFDKILSLYKPIHLIILTILFLLGVYGYAYFDTFYLRESAMLTKSLSFILLLLYFLHRYEHKIGKPFPLVAEMSFGIFFVHEYINWVFFKLDMLGLFTFAGSFTNLILITSLNIMISMIILWIFHKIFGRNSRSLVGY